jgi:hypothetical protein
LQAAALGWRSIGGKPESRRAWLGKRSSAIRNDRNRSTDVIDNDRL